MPWWWKKKAKEAPATFNARAESVAEKPMFRDAFKRSRCLIPASGYYEWQKTPTGKQPYYYIARDGSPLTIAGLWDEWKDIETGEPLKSCTMIITNANELASKIHDRMPVLLQPKDFDGWPTTWLNNFPVPSAAPLTHCRPSVAQLGRRRFSDPRSFLPFARQT